MANYLGKISAIVSANTAGYVRGINEAAAQTRNFAKTVQSDINRASRDADRSLKSILTPLQQFQRSLNAAVSQRLAFKGVDGIVTGIGQLQTKLRELQRQGSSAVDLALNISGRESVDKLIEDLDVLDGKTVQAVIQAVNAESISRAKAQLEQLFSVANEIAKPLSAAVKQFERLGLGVQASFTPALNVAQTAVQELEATIREGGQVGQDEFDRVARVVDRTTASIRRLSEASAAVDALPTGQEFQFQDPRLAQRLQAASRATTDAAALPAETIESAGVARLVSQLRQASDFALETQTRLENARAQGLAEDTARISGQLNTAGQTVDKITRVLQASGQLNILSDDDLQRSRDSGLAESLERDRRAAEEVAEALSSLRDRAAFTITGRVQNFEQVRQQLSQIVSQIGELDVATTAGFDLDIGTLNRIVSEEDLRDLPTAQAIIDRITSALGQRRSLDIETETAQREAEQLAATIDRLRANADFAITGRPQNLDQVQSELQRILGTIDRLNDQQRGELRVSAVIDAINAGDLQQAQQALADLKQQAEAGARFNLDAEEAQRAATDLQNRLAGIRERVEFTITGNVQNFDQARQELNSLLGDVSRLDQAARSAFSQRLQTAGEIIESGEVSKLEQAAAILQQVRAEVAGIAQTPVKDPLGPALDDPIRQVDVLKGGINSLQGQLDNLPAPIRQRFLPELRRLRDQFTQAEKSPQRFGQELENAADDVRRLSAEVRRIGQAQGLGSFADGLDDTALRGALGSLQALQQVLNRVGATAGSDGAKQFDRLRDAIQRATNAGTIGSEAFQRELEQITQEAAAAAAATGKIGRSAAFREIKRGGDIARGGFDKISLATQQAAFAIDDFFSATGDFTQKIRAVQNNVTQLAFILGGTTGLFVGLGVAIAAQAAVALFKFFNETEKAKLGLEFLNEELQKSKSLAEQNADAFRDLADAVAQAGSGFGANATRFQIDETLSQQREARREQAEQNIVTTNPRIIEAEAEVRRLEQRLEEASTPAERSAVAVELGRARRIARINRRAVLSDPSQSSFDAGGVQRSLQQARDAELESIRATQAESRPLTDLIFGGDPIRRADRRRELESSRALRPQTVGQAAEAVDDQILELKKALDDIGFVDRFFGKGSELEEQIERLTEERGRLRFQIEAGINDTLEQISRDLLVSSAEIRGTLQGLSDLGLDADIVSPLADEIAAQAEVLRQAQRDAERAAEVGGDDGKRLAEEAQKRSEEARQALAETFAKIDDLARRVSLGAEVSIGQRLKGALDQVGDLGPSIVETSLRRAKAELEQIDRQRERAVIAGDDDAVAELDRQRKELREQTDALEKSVVALLGFQAAAEAAALALQRTVTSQREQAAEQSRRRANEAEAVFGPKSPFAQEARARQERDEFAARQAQKSQREADRELGRQRELFEREILENPNSPAARRAERIVELNQIAADKTRTPQEQREARDEARRLEAQQQADFEQRPGVQAARRRADEADIALQQRQSADRAFERGRTERQRQEREAAGIAGDLRNLFGQDNIVNPNEQRDLVNATVRSEAQRVAPLLVQFAEQRQNATLQGPSRAALQAQSITTSQGASELNRLLRGDDSARNVNLVELRKQTSQLDILIRKIEEATGVVATVDS